MTGLRFRRVAGTSLAMAAGAVLGFGAVISPPPASPAPPEPDAASFVAIRVDEVTPDVVSTASDPTVTVTGVVSNVGDRKVRDVVVRLEYAGAVASSAGLRTNLRGASDQFRPVGGFVPVVDELQRGQDARFRLSVPVWSLNRPGLEIDRPGVYPLLVNVNGTPAYGEPAKLDDARFLLPVTGLPKTAEGRDSEPPAATDAPAPVRLTMLWPLADRPRLTPGVPGGTVPVRLADDELATSLAPGGRLDTLLSAAESATAQPTDPRGAVTESLCLAVDPDLLVTVNAMTGGYVVADSADDGVDRPGTGRAAAVGWLDRLRRLAHRLCTAAVPYAQADLDAVHRVGDPGLGAAAVTQPADIVDQILGAASVRGVTLLADGQLTHNTLALLDTAGDTVVIAAGDCSDEGSGSGAPATADVTPHRLSDRVVVVPFDPAVGAALAGMGVAPAAPTYLDPSLAVRLEHDSATARRQNALGALLWRALEPSETSAEPRTQVALPPGYWNPRTDDAQLVLNTLATALQSGLAVPEPLAGVIAASRTASSVSPRLPADESAAARFDSAVVDDIAGQMGRLWGLTNALTTDTRTGLTGDQYTAPLREDMLRALSQAEPDGERNTAAGDRIASTARTVDDLFAAVTIVHPAGTYTLATEHSPLPLALHNELPVPIRVRLQIDAPAGMSATDIGEIELPPGYLPLRVPVQVRFNQRVAVDVALQTPDGLPLGEPARLSIHANAYGRVLFAITVIAGTVLAALTGRRFWHRLRGQPDRADLDRPEPPWVPDGESDNSAARAESGARR